MKIITLIILCCTAGTLLAQQVNTPGKIMLSREVAAKLAALPLHCINQEWPNKTSHSSDSSTDHVLLPHELHPSFYGCFDWHSSVHGHWMLIKLLKTLPDMAERERIVAVLDNSFQPDKINGEAAYFSKYKTSYSFERTYGWAWLLKLDQELYTWNDTLGQKWYRNLQPLTKKIVATWSAFLPKQTYPNRTGVHPNTAFGLVFALDWARTTKDKIFEKVIVESSRNYYAGNKNIPANYEPDGTDFLSPSLETADLMRRVLPAPEFIKWFDAFFTAEGIKKITQFPVVSDRTDIQIVHLDGLSLSRAWCMKGIAAVLPATHRYKKLFAETSADFLQKTLPYVTSGNYGGDHWLASFALYAMLL